MRPNPTVTGSLASLTLFRHPWLTRVFFAIAISVLIFLGFFPERYRAAVTLTPSDPASLGLNPTVGQFSGLGNVFGNQSQVEVALKVARSFDVREDVAKQLDLMNRRHFRNRIEMHRWLDDLMTVRTLRGGIIQFETLNQDASLAKDLVGAYASATQSELAVINRKQTDFKRDTLLRLVADASDRVARARNAYDQFRLSGGYALPTASIQAISKQIPYLEAEIQSKEVEFNTQRQFATDENFYVKRLSAEIGALRRQLALAKAKNPLGENSLGRAVLASTQAQKLERDLAVAETLYSTYIRFLEATSVEGLTSSASVRILEPPYIDTQRQLNWNALGAAIALLLLWLTLEFYGLRPPIGDARVRQRQGLPPAMVHDA